MELLEKLPLKAAQWLLWDYLPDVDDDDYTLEQLLKYDPRGAFEDNLNDMSKYDAVAAMTTLIHKLLPGLTKLKPDTVIWSPTIHFYNEETDERERYLRKCIEEEEHETRGLNGSYDEYIDEYSDADPGL